MTGSGTRPPGNPLDAIYCGFCGSWFDPVDEMEHGLGVCFLDEVYNLSNEGR